MMQPRRIFEHAKIHVVAWGAEPGGLRPVDADLLAGLDAVLQETRLETGVRPCLRDQAGARGRSDRLGPFGEPAMVLRGKQAMLDRKLPHGNLQNLEVSDLFHRWRRYMIVAIPGVFVCCLHVRSFLISADRSISNGLEPAIRELGLQRILLGRVLLPEILLTEPDDVILFEPAITVKGFIIGNEVLV